MQADISNNGGAEPMPHLNHPIIRQQQAYEDDEDDEEEELADIKQEGGVVYKINKKGRRVVSYPNQHRYDVNSHHESIEAMDTSQKVKSRWTRSFFTALNRRNDDERYVCDICHKDLASRSSLTLHRNTHVIERRYKCEPCQVSFHSQGHLQKHMRSTAHETRVEMTQAFGIPTLDNPRPYGCPQCDVAFRKHGHLAKHLRSKSHITKMESNGLVPVGTYAALEKCGAEIRDRLVTTNCEQSLQSLRSIVLQLFHPASTSSASLSSPSSSSSLSLSATPQHQHQPLPSQSTPASNFSAVHSSITPPHHVTTSGGSAMMPISMPVAASKQPASLPMASSCVGPPFYSSMDANHQHHHLHQQQHSPITLPNVLSLTPSTSTSSLHHQQANQLSPPPPPLTQQQSTLQTTLQPSSLACWPNQLALDNCYAFDGISTQAQPPPPLVPYSQQAPHLRQQQSIQTSGMLSSPAVQPQHTSAPPPLLSSAPTNATSTSNLAYVQETNHVGNQSSRAYQSTTQLQYDLPYYPMAPTMNQTDII